MLSTLQTLQRAPFTHRVPLTALRIEIVHTAIWLSLLLVDRVNSPARNENEWFIKLEPKKALTKKETHSQNAAAQKNGK